MKIQYRKIVKVMDDSPKAAFKRVVLRLMRGVYKQEVTRLTEVQSPISSCLLQTVTPAQRTLLERLLTEQERLIVAVILLEAQLTGTRPHKYT